MTKVRKMRKPRASHLNDVLMSKKGGAHEPKTGEHAKRARRKNQDRKELIKQLTNC